MSERWQLIKPAESSAKAKRIAENYSVRHPTTKIRIRKTNSFPGYNYVVEYEVSKAGRLIGSQETFGIFGA